MKSQLLLISGHGGADPGAVRGELVERELNRAVVLGANDYIRRTYRTPPTRLEVLVYSDRAPLDGSSQLLAKIAHANALGPDLLVVEVHHNANAAGTGAQVWTSQRARSKPGDETAIAAPLFAAELGRLVGEPVPILSSDRARFGKLGMVDDVSATALLIECRNLTNPRDDDPDVPEPEDRDPDVLYANGAAIANACAAYFGWARQQRADLLTALRAARASVDEAIAIAEKGG